MQDTDVIVNYFLCIEAPVVILEAVGDSVIMELLEVSKLQTMAEGHKTARDALKAALSC